MFCISKGGNSMLSKKSFIILAVVLFYNFLEGYAYAYLDPGTGSYVIQVMIAVIISGFFVIKSFWHRLRAFFKRLLSKGDIEK